MAEVIKGADVFLGLSVAGQLSKDMVSSMAKDPIIFACANPDPEIPYPDAKEVRPDTIMATGRSDYPNQVNNVLGFPFIFRGALDVRASAINEEMKVAAAQALADLAKEPVPDEVKKAYGVSDMEFGIDYIIPKPLDLRVIEFESAAVAQAAMDTGVAREPISDMDGYRAALRERIDKAQNRIKDFIDSYDLGEF
jgi:malate dehydrogenase (oxaloacetate-decarboxylating)(NADP+)